MAQTKRRMTASEKAKRAEYTKLRDIARKRILRAHEQGELLEMGLPVKLSDINNTRQLDKELERLNRFLKSMASTDKGRKELQRRRIEGYRKAGYFNINKRNEKLFTDFMKLMIKKYSTETPQGKKLFHDSDTFFEFFDQMVEEDRVHEKTRLSDLVRMFNKWVG